MNSTEEITIYKDPNDLYQSPTLTRRTLGYSYDFPEKSQKKDKKWSIGNIFRRKKKDESDSSSEEESHKKGFLGRRRKKPETKRKKPIKPVGTFDHVVIPPVPRNSMIYNGYNCQDDPGILSDPTGGFSNYIGRALPQIPINDTSQKVSRESLNDINNSRISLGSGSVDSVTRKSRREMAKVRAAARRTSSKNGSSSEEDSQRSNSSLKIRSEENLRQRDASSSRKSRAARTERYLKRHSRDGENPHNYLRLSKSDAENSAMNWKLSDDSNRSPSRSPLIPSPIIPMSAKNKLSYSSLNSQSTNMSGLSTIPPSHSSHNKYRVSNSTSNPSYKPPQSMNDYNSSTKKFMDFNMEKYLNNHRSISCDANIHKAPSAEFNEEVLHVQFPITRPNRGYRNLSLIDASQINRARQPPPPPPRDPNRMMAAHYSENGRPNTYYFDSSGQFKSRSFSGSNPHPSMQQTRKYNSFNLHPNYRSASEDQLLKEPLNIHLAARPSSTTPDTEKPQRFITRRREIKTNPDSFNYLTDKNPRSRKPIFIQAGNKNSNANEPKPADTTNSHKALDFWKQIDRQNVNLNEKPVLRKSRSNSPQMFTSHTHVQTKVFLPSVLQTDINNSNSNNKLLDVNRGSSPFKPVSPIAQEVINIEKNEPEMPLMLDHIDKEDVKRKSANLEEALDELEAIYNSLRLGDEDLLERAEQREKETQAKKCLEANIDPYPGYRSTGTLSDSSFSYEPFDTVDSPRRKRMFRKNRTADIKHDDMAFRKINKERATTISDPQSVISKVSYLLSSPVHKSPVDGDKEIHNVDDEPDITFDDVVYRNVKHANNSLKVVEPQPPFGIPLGPITPAANSDYLHAKPEDIYRPVFKSRKIPDIVKDDLAFRNLRKDANKGPALPPLSAEDFRNNNSSLENNGLDLNYLRKKRAQRSLSANIGSLIHSDIIEKARNKHMPNNNDVDNEFKTLTDIADAMEIARKVLREKENKITATRKAFMSDTDTKYVQPVSNANSLRESRRNFLNGLKTSSTHLTQENKPTSPLLGDDILTAKPPRGLTPERKARSPKESTPIPISPLEDKKSLSESTSSSLEDLLNALAEEAKETTERITNELKMLGEEKEKRSSLKKNEINIENREDKSSDLNKRLSEIDAVSQHAKMCEKLLECVVDSTDLMASTKTPVEEVKQIDLKPAIVESANVVLSRVDSKEETLKQTEEKSDSDHDYENLVSDKELNIDEVDVVTSLEENKEPEKCRSPFEEHKAELVASFQELKQNIGSIELSLKKEHVNNVTEDNDGDGAGKRKSNIDSIYDNLETNDKVNNENNGVTGEEECVGVLRVVALPAKECAFVTESKYSTNTVDCEQIFTSNCDIILSRPNNFRTAVSEYIPEDSESSSGFHSNCSCGENSHYLKPDIMFEGFGSNNNLDSLESLKSPKLVLETSNKVLFGENSDINLNKPKAISEDAHSVPISSRLVLEATESTNTHLFKGRPKVVSSCSQTSLSQLSYGMRNSRLTSESRRVNSSDRHILDDDEKPTPTWYRDPATMAVACSYGIACAHQLASIDIFAILGILFAVISFIAALFL
ncbi:hypothetical protein NQ314_005537 [Rhamnusium bicolor]|uniref:Uncharacterized protein n=1 Tax=Rhamnusium bicolor TaxID=1586634 RepID=A0AAV8ZH45_9CUCU|nr:hypothetical protein NQ314_005537 [Rhamnusium bicolor]